MGLRSQGPPGLASNRDRRDVPPWRALPLVVVVVINELIVLSIRLFGKFLFIKAGFMVIISWWKTDNA